MKPIQYNLINRLAWSFSNTSGAAFDELQSEATLLYLEAAESYDESKGAAFTTYAYRFIQNRLINFLKRESRSTHLLLDDLYEKGSYQTPFFEIVECLSDKAKYVAKMVLQDYNKYAGRTAWQARGDIGRDLKKQGWKDFHIACVMKELKTIFA